MLPLAQQDVEVAATLEEAQVVRGGGGGEDPLKVPPTAQLVFALSQHRHVLRGEHVQHAGVQVLTHNHAQHTIIHTDQQYYRTYRTTHYYTH